VNQSYASSALFYHLKERQLCQVPCVGNVANHMGADAESLCTLAMASQLDGGTRSHSGHVAVFCYWTLSTCIRAVHTGGFAPLSLTHARLCRSHHTLHKNQAVSNALLPLLKDNARVVNVGSMSGELNKYSAELRTRFLAADLTEKQLDDLVGEFKKHVGDGDHAAHGWPNSTYSVSKAALHALTRIHARDIGAYTSSSGVTVNAICPGWCRTNMAGDKAPRTAAEGADTPVWLAHTPPGPHAPTGKFFRDRTEVSW
jgi:carbonyl reductase 1